MSQIFYLENAQKTADKKERQVLLQLAKEEAGQLKILDNIVKIVLPPEPRNWIENAEGIYLGTY